MKIETDKVYHFAAGMIISVITAFIANIFIGNILSCMIGFIVGSMVGILKELVWYGYLKGTKSKKDAIVTIIGAAHGSIILYLFSLAS